MIQTNKSDNKKFYILLLVACITLYLISICIKMVYSASLVEIIVSFNESKSRVGLGLTFYYVTYALTQIIFSYYLSRMNVRAFLVVTTVLSALSFGMIFFVNKLWQLWIIFGVNGIFQAGIYGGCMSLFGKYLPDSWSPVVSKIMSLPLSLGTAITYGFAALFIGVFKNWKYTFVFFAVILLFSVVFFYIAEKLVEKKVGALDKQEKSQEKEVQTSGGLIETMPKNKLASLLIYIYLTSFLVTCSYYAITNWVPNLLKEVFLVPTEYSLLITILMPIGMISGPIITNDVCERRDNLFAVNAFFMSISALLLFVLIFAYSINMVLVIVLLLVLLICNRGIINVMAVYIPLKMKHAIDAGKSSLIINAFASLGAAVVPFLTGLVMDCYSWKVYFIFTFLLVSLVVVLFAVGAIKQGKRKLF